uniref:Uncharacterized protein n=1 Tax=Sphaerodactylus townsendi TaxID=933632 RepID=A0ACB8FMR4_9SAUR
MGSAQKTLLGTGSDNRDRRRAQHIGRFERNDKAVVILHGHLERCHVLEGEKKRRSRATLLLKSQGKGIFSSLLKDFAFDGPQERSFRRGGWRLLRQELLLQFVLPALICLLPPRWRLFIKGSKRAFKKMSHLHGFSPVLETVFQITLQMLGACR